MATTPYSPSSGYWSANEDETSDLSAFNPLTLSPTWLLSPDTQFRPDVMPEKQEIETQLLLRVHSEIQSKVESSPEVEAELRLDELNATPEPEIGDPDFEPEADESLPTGSSLLADFLFGDFLQSSHHQDRMLDDINDDVMLPVDEIQLLSGFSYEDDFRSAEQDSYDVWKDSSGSPLELDMQEPLRTGFADEFNFDSDQLFSNDEPISEFLNQIQNHSNRCSLLSSSPINRIICDQNEPKVRPRSLSGWTSPLDGESDDVTPHPFIRSSLLESDEYLDFLLLETLNHTPSIQEDGAKPEVSKPELILVAAPSATKRQSSEIDQKPRKMVRIRHLVDFASNIKEETEWLSADVISGADSTSSEVTSASDRLKEKEENAELEIFQKIQESQAANKSKTSEREKEIFSDDSPSVASTAKRLQNETDTGNADFACAARKAEVLAMMLKAEGVLKEPNRGSDVIFEELRNRRAAAAAVVISSGSSPLVLSSPSGQRGATSLRSFLIQKQRQSQDSQNMGQNLLHRLLKGQTTEAEIRREMEAKDRTKADQAQ